MEKLTYTIVIVNTKRLRSVTCGVPFNSREEADRYAEGITVGASLAGERFGVMMLLNDEYNPYTAISKQMDYRKMQVFFREYKWNKEESGSSLPAGVTSNGKEECNG